VVALVAASPAVAQAPPPLAGEPADIAACLCLGQAVTTLNADMTAQQSAYAAARADLTRLDAELKSARAGMDVNDPAAVARFRQLLEQRDSAFRRSTGLATGDLNSAISRYNARVNEFNARCANRPRNPDLLAQVQATLRCPPPY
jgi:phage-related tail protein